MQVYIADASEAAMLEAREMEAREMDEELGEHNKLELAFLEEGEHQRDDDIMS